jgi:hypothetical protein
VVADALRGAGAQVQVHDDVFDQGTEDTVWITEVARREWVILTKDARIRKRLNERRAVTVSKAMVFALTSQDLPGEQMASIFVKHLHRMRNLIRSGRPPFWAKVTRETVKLLTLATDDSEETAE